ncbi:MAG: hypothetical protein ACI9KE_003329 [Polyangiales bacterium]|jgi:hypothetical protein
MGFGLGAAFVSGRAFARPVRVGRFATISFGVSSAHPWPSVGGGAHRAFRSRGEAPIRPPDRVWQTRIGPRASYPPLVLESGATISAHRDGLTALSPAGVERWTAPLRRPLSTPSVLPDGGHVIIAGNGEVNFFRGPTATMPARVAGTGSPLVLDDGSSVVLGRTGILHRIDPSGRVLHEQNLNGPPIRKAMIASDGRALVIPLGRELIRTNFRGERQSSVTLSQTISMGPALARDGSAWVATADHRLHLVSPSSEVLVSTQLDVAPRPSSCLAVANDGSVRYGAGAGGVVCVEGSGQIRWRQQDLGPVAVKLSVDSRGACLLTNRAGELVVLEPDGSIRFRVPIGAPSYAAPVLGRGGSIYVTTLPGHLQHWRVPNPL